MTSNNITPEPTSERISLPRLNVQPTRPAAATVHCTIVAVDIVGFGSFNRTNTNMVRVRDGLYRAVQKAFDSAGIPWESCHREDRGDGILMLAPADIPKTLFANYLPDALLDALVAHNRIHPREEEIRLRLAIHAGEIAYDEHGVTGASINHTFRLLDSTELRTATEHQDAVLAVVGSSWFFDEVIRHSERSRAQDYQPADITNKETTTQAWIRLLPKSSRSWRRLDPPERISPHQLYTQLEHHAADSAPYDDRAGLARLTAWMAEDAEEADINGGPPHGHGDPTGATPP